MIDDSNDSLKQFQFDIVNGQVIAFFEIENGITKQESIDSRDSFEITGNQIIHTEIKSDGVETTVYLDEDGDGFYTIFSESNEDDDDDSGGGSGGERKLFVFETNGSEVTAVFEVEDDGQLEFEPIEANESYTIDGNDIIRTEIEDFGTEIKRFSDPDGDGFYQRVSEQWIPFQDNPINVPTQVITQPLRYFASDDDDFIAVRGDEPSEGGLGADSFVLRLATGAPTHWHIEDFDSNEGDLITFDLGVGLTSLEHVTSFVTEVSYDGQSLFIGFVADISLTLVGVAPDSLSSESFEVLS